MQRFLRWLNDLLLLLVDTRDMNQFGDEGNAARESMHRRLHPEESGKDCGDVVERKET